MHNLKSALLAAILFASMQAYASEDDHQGFMLGFGAGFGPIKTDNLSGSPGSTLKNSLATSLKIGAGITSRFALYYVRNNSWFRAYPPGSATKEVTYTIGIKGLEAAYFLEPTAPSAYFLAAKGTGYISTPFKSGNQPDTGRAVMFGGGYEFEKNITIEGTLLTTRIDSISIPTVNLKSSAIQITINYLYY